MIQVITDTDEWDKFVLDNDGHPLQLSGWGELKHSHGWNVARVKFGAAQQHGAQLLIKPLPFPFRCLVYVPRGPFSRENLTTAELTDLVEYVKRTYQPTHLSIEPHQNEFSREKPWTLSKQTILVPRTAILDLGKSKDELLAAMTKKTRQYIRKSQNEDIEIFHVKSMSELSRCLEIYRQTAKRAGFALHNEAYYLDVQRKLGDHSMVFAAYQGDEPIAFLWLAASREVAFELYGGVNETGQRLRANYALKWHAISLCKDWGITYYDMNGLLNDGISTFKRGFSDHENTLVGTLDYPMSPLYYAWTIILPLAKRIVRTLKSLQK